MADAFRQRTLGNQGPTEAETLSALDAVLLEHGEAREAAAMAINQVCGLCHGEKRVVSVIDTGQMIECYACKGTGEPNDVCKSLPALDAGDQERLWKVRRLLQGKHSSAVLKRLREVWPQMFSDAAGNSEN